MPAVCSHVCLSVPFAAAAAAVYFHTGGSGVLLLWWWCACACVGVFFMSAAEVGNSPKTKFPTSSLFCVVALFLKIDLPELRLKTR